MAAVDSSLDVKRSEEIKEAANRAFQEHKFLRAVDLYSDAIQLNESNAILWANRAFAHTKIEEYGSAVEDAAKAIELNPSYVKGYYRRGTAYLAMGKFKDALKDFKQAAKIAPRDPDARKKLKECEKAVREEAFQNAIASPDSGPVGFRDFGIDVSSIEVDATYDGPRLEGEEVTLSFVQKMMDAFKNQKMLHRRYAYQILFQIREQLRALPSLVDIQVPDGQHITVCGDIHGQFFDLMNIFELNGLPSDANPYLFNGDFVDRGSFSIECIFTLFAFKCLYPTGLYLARGNHESRSMNRIYGFDGEVKAKCGEPMVELFADVFCCLPLAHVISSRVFVVHGGLFSKDGVTLDDVRGINRFQEPPDEGLMCEVLWSDPFSGQGRMPSKRGVGVAFGSDVTKRFLQDNKLDLVVQWATRVPSSASKHLILSPTSPLTLPCPTRMCGPWRMHPTSPRSSSYLHPRHDKVLGNQFHVDLPSCRKELGPPPGPKILLEVMTAVAVRFLGGKSWEVSEYREVLEKVWSDPGDESDDDDVDAAESNNMQQQKARRMELFAAVDNKSLRASLVQKYPVAEAAKLVRRYMDDSWARFGRPSLDGIAEQVLLGNMIMRTDAVWGEGRERRGGGGGHGDGADSLDGLSIITDGGLAGSGECDTEVGCPKGYATVAAHDLIRSWFPEGLNRGARKHEDPREEKQQQDQVQRKQGQSQEPQGQPKQQQQQSTRAQNQEEAYEAVQQAQNHEAAPSAATTTAATVSGDAEQMVRELRESSARLKAVGQDPLPDALRLAEAAKAQVRDQARGKAGGEARNGGLGEEREVFQGSKARGGGRKERVGLEQVREEEEEEEGEEERRTNEAGMRRKGKKQGEEGGRRVASDTGLEVLGKGGGERRRRGEDGREEDGEGREGGGRRRRRMDPQPTARILEWSDDDGELEETQEPAQPQGPNNRHGRTSMPATVHLRTPSAPHLSPLNLHAASPGTAAGAAGRGGTGQGVRRGGTVTATGKLRRPKRPFSAEETDTLKIGVMR
ncbi:unnamed protein product [Closterium sp. NIES-54]